MPRRCSPGKRCSYPRAGWWKTQLGTNYYYGSGGAQAITNQFIARVSADGGIVEAESCLIDRIQSLQSLGMWGKASIVWLPHGVKTNKLYAIVPSSGAGDLAFTRAGTKTRVNSSNTIETVATGVPSLDYTNDTCPALALEPARTNLFLQSETLATQNVTVSAIPYTISFYGTGTITLSGASTAGPLAGTGTNRVTLTFTPTAGTLTCTVSGTVTKGQCEAGSYASSYIPTTTGTVLRIADSVNDLIGVTDLIGQTEGTLYWEMNVTASNEGRIFAISDGSVNNRIWLYVSTTNEIGFFIASGGVTQVDIRIVVTTGSYKVAGVYRDNYAALFINGVRISEYYEGQIKLEGDDTTVTVPAVSNIYFNTSGGSLLKGNIKSIVVMKTAISDTEAITLTT